MDINILIKRKEKELKAVMENILDFSESKDVELINAVPTYEMRRIELQTELEVLKENESRQHGCGWCKRTDGYDRIECVPIDHEGHNLAVDHQIVWCVAEYCPVCGRKLTT